MSLAATRAAPAPALGDVELSRRRLLRGTAWAAPAIVVATAVPAVASSVASTHPVLTGTFSAATHSGAVMRSGEGTVHDIEGVYLKVTYVHDRSNADADVEETHGTFDVSGLTQPGSDGIGHFTLTLRLNGGNLTHGNPAGSFALSMRKVRAVTRVVAHGVIDGIEHASTLYEM